MTISDSPYMRTVFLTFKMC